jgi:1-acyl-sn-glycerol-3-phosphate acyltransferase
MPFAAVSRWLARGLVRFYYPRIEIEGAERIPATGPVLLAANHPNSLIDPVVLGIVARRSVSLLAKAPLFEVPLFGAALRALGMIPVYRGADDPKEVKKNLASLTTAAAALQAGGLVGIFPEGKTHDAVRMALVRSGAARLALQAHALGTPGLLVIPVALNYERKERFRSALWVRVGEPIVIADWLAQHEDEEHRAMRALTPELDSRLRRDLVDLADPAWEDLLDDVTWLLPAARRTASAGLTALRVRKQAADAINHFHRADPARAATAAARVRAHAQSLHELGLRGDARLLSQRPLSVVGWLIRDAFAGLMGGVWALFGLLAHIVPVGLARIVAALLGRTGRTTLALWRLLIGGLLLLAWYAGLALLSRAYFQSWVVILGSVLLPASGLFALGWWRRQQVSARRWWAELRLLFSPRRARSLATEHAALSDELEKFAREWAEQPAARPALPRDASAHRTLASVQRHLRLLKPPAWVSWALGSIAAALIAGAAVWVIHDHPLEWRRTDSPALHQMADGALSAQLAADTRALAGVIAGVRDLDTRFRAFEAELLAGRKSYYNPQDDDEIRRMVVTFLALRDATLRLTWRYERHAQLNPGPTRAEAETLHAAALVLSYDLALRFVLAFSDDEQAQLKLNEAEPRWQLPAGVYDTLRATLASRQYRRDTTTAHAALAAHSANEPMLAEARHRFEREAPAWLTAKLATGADSLGGFARGNYYRASARVSTLIGDSRLRAPRQGQALIAPAQVTELRTKLQPGDILIERRNWYLSNAFLPGYWPHAALYVGTAEELRALGWHDDPRIAAKLAAFAEKDHAGHAPAVIEAMSEGVVFTTLEHSAGEADCVAVLRPRVDAAARQEIVARGFDHAGKPYDFDFDFFSADKLVCTEVVYRATAGYVDLPLSEILGRKTLPALEVVRYALSEKGGAQLEFIAFLDGDERRGDAVWADRETLKQSCDRPALTWLQN